MTLGAPARQRGEAQSRGQLPAARRPPTPGSRPQPWAHQALPSGSSQSRYSGTPGPTGSHLVPSRPGPSVTPIRLGWPLSSDPHRPPRPAPPSAPQGRRKPRLSVRPPSAKAEPAWSSRGAEDPGKRGLGRGGGDTAAKSGEGRRASSQALTTIRTHDQGHAQDSP